MIDDFISRLARYLHRKIYAADGKYDPIRMIDRIIGRTTDPERMMDLACLKISFLREFRRNIEAYSAILDLVSINPLRPESWLHLLIHYRDDMQDKHKSLAVSNICVAVAKLDRNFVIQCLNEKAKTAAVFDDVAVLIDCLNEIMIYKRGRGEIDEAYRTDFLKINKNLELPKNVIDNYINYISLNE